MDTTRPDLDADTGKGECRQRLLCMARAIPRGRAAQGAEGVLLGARKDEIPHPWARSIPNRVAAGGQRMSEGRLEQARTSL